MSKPLMSERPVSKTSNQTEHTTPEPLQKFDKVQNSCEKAQSRRARAVRMLLGELDRLEPEEQKAALQAVAARMPAGDMSEAFVKQAAARAVPLYTAASFRAQMAIATRRRQLADFKPELGLNNKTTGYRFVEKLSRLTSLQVKTPKVFSKGKSFNDTELPAGSVLKPMNGSSSIGIFIVFASDDIREVKTGNTLRSMTALKARVDELVVAGKVRDSWFVEELIANDIDGDVQPAADLKFYCFYGKLGFVLEAERSHGGHYCEWLPDGKRANTGRYQDKQFAGQGFTQQQADLALAISKHIAAPFMRIDFLRAGSHFTFCEFTPRPGQFNAFNNDFDRYLGELYLDAEARLSKDLLQGEEFKVFKSVCMKSATVKPAHKRL